MAEIAPFRALRYDLSRVGDAAALLAPPYDVVSERDREVLEALHPHNVIRLELPRGEGDAKYTAAARLLGAWTREGVLRLDERPAMYVYEQRFRYPAHAGSNDGGTDYTRRGFFCRLRLEPFARRVVLPHEHTLAAPKADRLKLMRATGTHLSQVFGLFRDPAGAAAAVLEAAALAQAPVLDATTADGCRHRLWMVTDAGAHATLAGVLQDKQVMIADGHHRYETMLALGDELRPPGTPPGGAAADWGAVFLARAEDPGLLVLPTHRLVRELPGFDMQALVARAERAFDVGTGFETSPAAIEARLADLRTMGRVAFAVRVEGRTETTWLALRPNADLAALGPPALRGLDVTVLHGLVLGPFLGIDAAAMARQAFLGYTHDTAEALEAVANHRAQAAFLMNATPVDDVLGACEAGFVLPQKSTYFQPKLATGLVMHPAGGLA